MAGPLCSCGMGSISVEQPPLADLKSLGFHGGPHSGAAWVEADLGLKGAGRGPIRKQEWGVQSNGAWPGGPLGGALRTVPAPCDR